MAHTTQDEINVFVKELRSRTRLWSEAAQELGATPGLRAVEFSADLLRAAVLSGSVKEWLTQLFEQLPRDVAIMDMDWLGGSVVFPRFGINTYSDRYAFIVGSREWEPIKEGNEIPLFTPTFRREWACKSGCGYGQNSIDRPTCEVCGRGRGA